MRPACATVERGRGQGGQGCRAGLGGGVPLLACVVLLAALGSAPRAHAIKNRPWRPIPYNPWTYRGPSARHGHAMTSTSDGSVWMFGGVSLGRRLDELLKLDRQAQEWTAIDKYGAWPDAREALAMTSVGLKVVLFGGLSQNDDGEGRSDELWEFDAVTMVFTRLYARGDSASASGPSARFGHAMSAIGTKVFVYGGVTDSIAYANDLWEWDMFTLDWTCLNAEAGVIGTVPSGRQYHTMVAVGTRLFLHGGETARVSPSGVQVICAGDCECPDLSAGEFSGKISDGPGPYSDNANCRWLITSEPGVTITFKFLDLDTGDDQSRHRQSLQRPIMQPVGD